MSKNIKILAYYLPQFHPIPENDKWWGKDFTEWTNVKKAQPLFNGHKQPVIPGELGYYDLLKQPEIQKKQADLAKKYGIDGFIYYQYWFGNGKMLLEKPAEQMLKDKSVTLPFCFCWANETWKGIWHGMDNPNTLIEQIYSGKEDYTNYFNYLLPFFNDDRYIKIDNKPVFIIYDAMVLDNDFINFFQDLAIKNKFEGLHFMVSNRGNNTIDYKAKGFQSKITGDYNVLLDKELEKARHYTVLDRILLRFNLGRKQPISLGYKKFFAKLNYTNSNLETFPMVVPNWDNTPRSKLKGFLFSNSSPKLFKTELIKAKNFLLKQNNINNIIVIKSWNEWAEGNYLEPDNANSTNWLEKVNELKNEF